MNKDTTILYGGLNNAKVVRGIHVLSFIVRESAENVMPWLSKTNLQSGSSYNTTVNYIDHIYFR